MKKTDGGFLLLELVAVAAAAATALISIFACYQWSIGMMLRHNQRMAAWEIAQRERASCSLLSENLTEHAADGFRVQILSETMPIHGEHRRYEILVYLEQETDPLVSLVGYE